MFCCLIKMILKTTETSEQGKQNWNIRYVAELALFSHEAGRYFILNFGIYCSSQSWWGRYFLMFLFYKYSEIANKMRQASTTISEVTHSIKKPCGRCNIKFIWQFIAHSFQILSKFILKNVKNWSPSLQDVEITL